MPKPSVGKSQGDGAVAVAAGKESEPEIILAPGKHDVLSGRGGKTNSHPGNINFRSLVARYKERYIISSKIHKPDVGREVVRVWQSLIPRGRFLKPARALAPKKGDDEIPWIEVDEKEAQKKACQCLREVTPDVEAIIAQVRQSREQAAAQGVSRVRLQLQSLLDGPAMMSSAGGVVVGGGGGCGSIQNHPLTVNNQDLRHVMVTPMNQGYDPTSSIRWSGGFGPSLVGPAHMAGPPASVGGVYTMNGQYGPLTAESWHVQPSLPAGYQFQGYYYTNEAQTQLHQQQPPQQVLPQDEVLAAPADRNLYHQPPPYGDLYPAGTPITPHAPSLGERWPDTDGKDNGPAPTDPTIAELSPQTTKTHKKDNDHKLDADWAINREERGGEEEKENGLHDWTSTKCNNSSSVKNHAGKEGVLADGFPVHDIQVSTEDANDCVERGDGEDGIGTGVEEADENAELVQLEEFNRNNFFYSHLPQERSISPIAVAADGAGAGSGGTHFVSRGGEVDNKSKELRTDEENTTECDNHKVRRDDRTSTVLTPRNANEGTRYQRSKKSKKSIAVTPPDQNKGNHQDDEHQAPMDWVIRRHTTDQVPTEPTPTCHPAAALAMDEHEKKENQDEGAVSTFYDSTCNLGTTNRTMGAFDEWYRDAQRAYLAKHRDTDPFSGLSDDDDDDYKIDDHAGSGQDGASIRDYDVVRQPKAEGVGYIKTQAPDCDPDNDCGVSIDIDDSEHHRYDNSPPASRRGFLRLPQQHRRNNSSEEDGMSLAMSLALSSIMDDSSEHSLRGEDARMMASSQSVASDMTDF